MKKFILKINEKVSIYYLVMFLLSFLAFCLPFSYENSRIEVSNGTDIMYTNSLCIFMRIYHLSTIYALIPIAIILILFLEIITSYTIYHKKRKLFNLTILCSLLINFVLSSVLLLSEGLPFIAFYLMLAVIVIHTVFTILCFVYKVNAAKIVEKFTEKPTTNANDFDTW